MKDTIRGNVDLDHSAKLSGNQRIGVFSGSREAESAKAHLKPMVLFYKNYLPGENPTDVERVMLNIRMRLE